MTRANGFNDARRKLAERGVTTGLENVAAALALHAVCND